MEKEFVPYSLAVKLKELGFDGPCLGVWNTPNGGYEVTLVYGGKLHEGYINDIQSFKVCAPLWQQAFDWFREKYNLISVIGFQNNYGYSYEIYSIKSKDCVEYIDGFGTYEEARLACLEKLIELVS